MSYLERIKTCNSYSLDDYLPFVVEHMRYGWIRKAFAEHLQKWTDVFNVYDHLVEFVPTLDSYQKRTEAIALVIEHLHKQNIISSWVGEPYLVNTSFGQKGVFEMERAATHYFGIRGYGVHMNGLVQKTDGIYVWIATRTRDKPFYPGKLDQIVAGGQPVGIGLKENLIKECAEEANIPSVLAEQAQDRGFIHYQMETFRGIDASTIYNYDLWLPEDFVPENTDGEVESFKLIPIHELAELTENTDEFKDNCNLTNIDLLIRSGVITETHPDYDEITKSLYAQV